MTTTFETIGRWMLAVPGAALVAVAVALVALDGTPRWVVLQSAGTLGGVMLVQAVVWLVVQRRFFGSPAALARTAREGRSTVATVREVRPTTSAIGADPVPVLVLDVDRTTLRRRVRVPIAHAAVVRPGAALYVRRDPRGSAVIVVDWERSVPVDAQGPRVG